MTRLSRRIDRRGVTSTVAGCKRIAAQLAPIISLSAARRPPPAARWRDAFPPIKQAMPSIDPHTVSKSVDSLLDLHDTAFVKAAYLAILERQADVDGLSFYLTRIRSGVAREQILLELAESPEGTLRPGSSVQLDVLRPRLPKPTTSVLDRILQRATRLSVEPLLIQGRRIENAVFRLLTEHAAAADRLEAQIAALQAGWSTAKATSEPAGAGNEALSAVRPIDREIRRMKQYIDAPGR